MYQDIGYKIISKKLKDKYMENTNEKDVNNTTVNANSEELKEPKEPMKMRCSLKKCPIYSRPCEFFKENVECITHKLCPKNKNAEYITIPKPSEEFFCLIIGSNNFFDYNCFKMEVDKVLEEHKEKSIIIISGGEKGPGLMAEKYADEEGYLYYVMRSDWGKHGKSAAYKRNDEMHRFLAQHDNRTCIAFWDEKTKDIPYNIDLANRYRTPIQIVSTKQRRKNNE